MPETNLSPYIHAANKQTFTDLVLNNSQKGPVLVNFWSKKAGPCIRQYPILEKIVEHYNGCLLLINIDVDSEQRIAADYAISSVPTLKLFKTQQPIETLHGFQNEADLKICLNRHVTLPSDIQLSVAMKQYSQGNIDKAYQIISQAIIEDPQNPRLPTTLCKLLKHEGKYQQSFELINSLPEAIKGSKDVLLIKDELQFILLAEQIKDVSGLIEKVKNNQADLDEYKQLSAFYILNKKYETALQQLMKMRLLSVENAANQAQQMIFKIFNLLGSQDPLVKSYREKLQQN